MPVKKANRINVRNLVYAEVLTDTKAGTTYGVIKPVAPAMQVQLTPQVAAGALYGDGLKQEEDVKLTGMQAVMDVNKVPIDVRADWYGHTYENGVVHEKDTDVAKYIAIGYLVEQTGGEAEYVWLLKGKPQPYGSTVQQTTENINYSTDSVTVNFIPRESDAEIRAFGDSADEAFVQAETWFDTVPGAAAP